MTARKKWWETKPVRFECQSDCFKCCTKPGIVYFEPAAIEKSAKFLKISPEQFRNEFLKWDDGHWVHDVGKGRPCAFLTLTGCAIQQSKPLQCRAYPFWHENMGSESMWRFVGAFCPGIGIGPAVSMVTIRKFLNKFKL